LHVVLVCIDEASRRLYRKFLNQLKAATEDVFVTIMNNLLTSSSADTILLPEAFEVTQNDLENLKSARQRSALSLKPSGQAFDLKDSSQTVKFI
jgi:hypothetical protein